MDVSSCYVDGTYALDHPEWHGERAGWKAGQVAAMLARHDLTPSSIVDVGCGVGGVVRILSKEYPATRFLGVDPSPHAVALANRSFIPPNVRIVQHSVTEVTEQFDVALVLDVFEHVDDYSGFLRKTSPVASRFVFHIPLDMNVLLVARRRALEHKRTVLGHLHYFNRLTALATLTDCGYTIIDEFYTASSYEGAGRNWKSKVKSLPRRACYAMNPDLCVSLLGGYSLCVLATANV